MEQLVTDMTADKSLAALQRTGEKVTSRLGHSWKLAIRFWVTDIHGRAEGGLRPRVAT